MPRSTGPSPGPGNPANIEYLQSRTGPFGPNRPQPNPARPGHSFWNDGIGSSHHEAGTLYMGAPGSSLTDTTGRFHGIDNAYVAGPALFPTLGSANPSLTALSLARRTAHTIVTDRTLSPPAGFTPLSLNPTDWTLVAQPGPTPPSNLSVRCWKPSAAGQYYYTKQQFGDATFWVEWRELHAGDNSGVYVRTPGPGGADPLTQADALGHEIQIDDLGAGNPPGQGIHRTGAIYGLQAPTAFPARRPANGTATSSKRPAEDQSHAQRAAGQRLHQHPSAEWLPRPAGTQLPVEDPIPQSAGQVAPQTGPRSIPDRTSTALALANLSAGDRLTSRI